MSFTEALLLQILSADFVDLTVTGEGSILKTSLVKWAKGDWRFIEFPMMRKEGDGFSKKISSVLGCLTYFNIF